MALPRRDVVVLQISFMSRAEAEILDLSECRNVRVPVSLQLEDKRM